MSREDRWTGRYTKVPWSVLEEPGMEDLGNLARRVRQMVREDQERRARRRAYVPRAIWNGILSRFGHRCAYCGRSDLPLQREHRMPLALGGPDTPSNLVPACRPCNSRKFKSHPDEWPLLVDPT